jgi:hypothetical protein
MIAAAARLADWVGTGPGFYLFQAAKEAPAKKVKH